MTIDVLLQMVVSISVKMSGSTEGRIETGITLHVGGLLVTGNIVSARRFLLEHPLTDKLLEVQEMLAKQEPVPAEETKDDLPEYIHLSDARFFIPGQTPIPTSGDGVYWRGRISEVSGFSFGILKVGPPQDAP